jgi:hypothetical protein
MHDQANDERPRQPFKEMRENYQLLVGFGQLWSAPVEMWLRRPGTTGDRNNGLHLVLGVFWILLFGALCNRPKETAPVVWFFCLTLLVLLIHRVAGIRRRSKGYRCHSRYTGQPWFPGRELWVKQWAEPTLILFVGIAIAWVTQPLGAYLIGAAISQVVCTNYQIAAEEARIRALRDAQIEQLYLMERFREEQ